MIRKHFSLSENNLLFIKKIQQERHLTSESAAVNYVISEYERRLTLANEVVELFNTYNESYMERLKWATQTAEQNSQVILDVLNTLLYEFQSESCISVEKLIHPVILESQTEMKKRITYFKQKKDNRNRKNRI